MAPGVGGGGQAGRRRRASEGGRILQARAVWTRAFITTTRVLPSSADNWASSQHNKHSRVRGQTMAPTRTAMAGGSWWAAQSVTFSLSAHKMGSMAPGVLATTFRISVSETHKRSL